MRPSSAFSSKFFPSVILRSKRARSKKESNKYWMRVGKRSSKTVKKNNWLRIGKRMEDDTSGGPDQGQAVLHAPHLTLVPQTVLADELQLLVKASLLEGPPWGGVHLGVLGWAAPIVPDSNHD